MTKHKFYKEVLKGYRRLTNIPLDDSSVFETLDDAYAYLNDNDERQTTAYLGQVISVLKSERDDEGQYIESITVYTVIKNPDNPELFSLLAIGSQNMNRTFIENINGKTPDVSGNIDIFSHNIYVIQGEVITPAELPTANEPGDVYYVKNIDVIPSNRYRVWALNEDYTPENGEAEYIWKPISINELKTIYDRLLNIPVELTAELGFVRDETSGLYDLLINNLATTSGTVENVDINNNKAIVNYETLITKIQSLQDIIVIDYADVTIDPDGRFVNRIILDLANDSTEDISFSGGMVISADEIFTSEGRQIFEVYEEIQDPIIISDLTTCEGRVIIEYALS